MQPIRDTYMRDADVLRCVQVCIRFKPPASCSHPITLPPLIIRWVLDTETGRCVPITYEICDPNAESGFATEQECLEECTDFTPPCDRPSCCSPVCALPLDNGSKPRPGPAPSCATRRLPYTNVPAVRWGYSEEECMCVEFKYLGCGGNGNNFETEKDCMHACMH